MEPGPDHVFHPNPPTKGGTGRKLHTCERSYYTQSLTSKFSSVQELGQVNEMPAFPSGSGVPSNSMLGSPSRITWKEKTEIFHELL